MEHDYFKQTLDFIYEFHKNVSYSLKYKDLKIPEEIHFTCYGLGEPGLDFIYDPICGPPEHKLHVQCCWDYTNTTWAVYQCIILVREDFVSGYIEKDIVQSDYKNEIYFLTHEEIVEVFNKWYKYSEDARIAFNVEYNSAPKD